MLSDFNSVIKIIYLLFCLALGLSAVIVVFAVLNRTKKKLLFKLIASFVFLNFALISVATGIFFASIQQIAPSIENTYPDTETQWDLYTKPLMVEFNVPVVKKNLNPSINPDINGYWVWEDFWGIKSITKKGYFYPNESLFNDQRIVVYITGISRIFKNENHEYGFVFDSPNLPSVTYSKPFNQEEEVSVDTNLELNFDKPNNGFAEFLYKFDPEVSYTIQEVSPTKILFEFNEPLKQSQTYTLKIQVRSVRKNFATNQVLETGNFEDNALISFTTKKEPLIKAISPSGTGVMPDSEIIVRFEVPMNQKSVLEKLNFSPSIEFNYEWDESYKILRIKPKELLPKDTLFKLTLHKGAQSQTGALSSKDVTYEFKTIGKIIVKNIEPQNESIGVKENSPIKIVFDQPVVKESAQNKFSISPKVLGEFSWENDKTMVFTPQQLNYNTTYTINIEPGIEAIYGLPNTDTYTSIFTVRSNQIIISMPQYFQPQSPPSFSCNIYAARMALAWKGYNVGIISLIAEIGYNDKFADGNWLGNPYKEYVGNYDGSWGYGVYWEPIQKLFTNRGIKTELNLNWNLASLAKSIENGHPVIIWRYNGESTNYDKNWTAEDGTFVRGINGQHGGVVTGFRGSSDNPTHFYLNDPWYGQIWIQASLFDYYWSRLGRVGLVIF